jgi:hypothetical protein
MRTRTLLLSAIVVTVLPIWLAGLAAGRGPSRPRPPAVRVTSASGVAAASAAGASRALAVLRRWDHRRARAWRRGDATALARIYAAGSRTGRRDVADLRRWRRRGLRVAGLRQQVSRVRLADGRRTHRDRVALVVTDRTVGGVAVGVGRRTPVPQSAWATQRIALRRSGGTWRVVEARARPG